MTCRSALFKLGCITEERNYRKNFLVIPYQRDKNSRFIPLVFSH